MELEVPVYRRLLEAIQIHMEAQGQRHQQQMVRANKNWIHKKGHNFSLWMHYSNGHHKRNFASIAKFHCFPSERVRSFDFINLNSCLMEMLTVYLLYSYCLLNILYFSWRRIHKTAQEFNGCRVRQTIVSRWGGNSTAASLSHEQRRTRRVHQKTEVWWHQASVSHWRKQETCRWGRFNRQTSQELSSTEVQIFSSLLY